MTEPFAKSGRGERYCVVKLSNGDQFDVELKPMHEITSSLNAAVEAREKSLRERVEQLEKELREAKGEK